ncbi:MAG: hypothetical protein N3F06_01070 [Nitrososphaerales archaeon]|nr:hypothetical protein [Nitrososphaerales archaeon]
MASSRLSRLKLRSFFKRPEVERRTALIMMALVAIFSIALILRIYPAKYGFYLNEFDPYFDYHATKYIVDSFERKGFSGLLDYFTWIDKRAWYPEGRNVAVSSQVGLHFAGALLYLIAKNIFGLSISLYDFLVLFPVFAGSFTIFAIYLFVKKVSGVGAGLLSSLIIALSPPIIHRGNLGWFKSEPFALLLAVFACYLFLTLYDIKVNKNELILRAFAVGFLLGYANTSWGGSLYFNIVFGIFFFIAPFIKDIDLRRTVYAGSVIVATNLIFSSIFPRPGPGIIANPAGLVILFGLLFTIISYLIRSSPFVRSYWKTLGITLFSIVLLISIIASFGGVYGVSGRYLTVVFPFIRSGNPLVESVAEHFVPTGSDYFSSYSILLIIAGFGAIIALRKRGLHYIFILILSTSGIYIASSFSRLMVYSSLAIAILAGIGFTELTSTIIKQIAKPSLKKFKAKPVGSEVKVLYSVCMIALLTLPVVYPRVNWLESADMPVSIVNAGTGYRIQFSDWFEALKWMRENTDPNAVFASWWDYGYWITVMGNRTSLADNATINSTRIAQLGRMFMSDEHTSLRILNDLKADYVLIFVVGQAIKTRDFTYYILGGGGDESKKQWFIRIGGLNITQYLYEDEFTPKPYFWESTLMGKLLPFTPITYGRFDQFGRLVDQSDEYKPGYTAIYVYDLKYPPDGDGPLRLAFASSSIREAKSGIFAGVLIYKIVK